MRELARDPFESKNVFSTLGDRCLHNSQSSIVSSVVDPFHFDTDPDQDPDPRICFR